MYNSVVKHISYDQSGVQVTAGNTVIAADAVVVTVPLGVLKKDSIKFEPALPERKLQAIRRWGFGVLNKASMQSCPDIMCATTDNQTGHDHSHNQDRFPPHTHWHPQQANCKLVLLHNVLC